MRISDWSSDVCSSDLSSGVESPSPRLRQTEDRYHESHRHNSEGIPQTGIRVPCPRYDILADKREEPAKIARSDMVGDRHGTVANSGRKQFGEKRGSRTISRSGKGAQPQDGEDDDRSEEHTSELQSLMRISYAVFCLKKQKHKRQQATNNIMR